MERYVYTNPNPKRKSAGDCVVRALSIALGETWEKIYIDLCAYGFKMADMPSANHVWGKYLTDKGFTRHTAETDTTVLEFCEKHPTNDFILGLDSHAVAAKNGRYFDAWDSGDEVVLYYWAMPERGE